MNLLVIDLHCAVIVDRRIINLWVITLDLTGITQAPISIKSMSDYISNASADCDKSLSALGDDYLDLIGAEP